MATYEAGELRLVLGADGQVHSLFDRTRKREHLPAGQSAPLLSLVVEGKERRPASLEADGDRLTLSYGEGMRATVRVKERPAHITFTLEAVAGAAPAQVTWGAFPTTIRQTIGATVGVVRDDEFALGIQALNVQTIAGAAGPTAYGSYLHAYAKEHDGGVRGSSIALFGCAAARALETIGKIEVTEGLPHPMLDGKWGKVSPTARLAYLITPFGEKNLDQVLAFAQKAGFRYVYHPGPFKTWGHFQLNPAEFPDGDASLRRCAERAAKGGIRLGLHTLTGFITTNDAYVTPVPDPRLARLGSTTLAGAVEENATEIPVVDPQVFRKRQTLSTAILGQELVQYDAVSTEAPWRLLGCKRGAFGTRNAPHPVGANIGKLADHEYRTFYPGIENGMMDEMTRRLVDLFNTVGLCQMSFDGLEGLSTYGYGEYARNRFVRQCFDGWKPEVITDASNLLHFNWHVHTRMNWGELTQSAKADVDTYRANNCRYFEDNLFPTGMGWWRFGGAGLDWEASRLEDIEYLLAKCAGYNATHGLATDPQAFLSHGQSEECLAMVKRWDEVRALGAFSPAQREKLREKGRDFHLDAAGPKRWRLTEARYSPFAWMSPGTWRTGAHDAGRHVLSFTTAGEEHPGGAVAVNNPFAPQPLRFEMRVLGAFDYQHAENLPLGRPAADFRHEPDLHADAPRVRVSEAQVNGLPGCAVSAKYEGKDRPSWVTRAIAAQPAPLNQGRQRGLGFWVRGDGKGELLFVELVSRGCKRQYYVPVDFTGERYFEFPLGEMCLGRYYAYDWNHWSGFASWWVTLKGFDYGRVDQVTIGFNRIPAGQEVSCAVAGLRALKELGAGLRNPAVELAGRRMVFQDTLPAGSYLVYPGGDTAEVRDANYRLLRTVPAGGDRLLLPEGKSTLNVSYEGADGPAPWSRWEVECRGPDEEVRMR